MSDSHQIEQFNIENPNRLYSKRESGMSTSSDIIEDEVDSNDNIIFESEAASLDLGLKSKYGVKRAYCGIRGDSEISCILNIVVSAIGGGCFSLPYLMYEGGIVVSLIIFLFVTVCVAYTIDLLRSFVVDTKYFSFALMTETILGPVWLKVYAVSSFVIYVSMEVSYLTSIYFYISSIILPQKQKNQENSENQEDSGTLLFRIIYFIITMIIEVFICLYISKIAKMHLLSIISISCFFLLLFTLIIISLVANIKGDVGSKFTYKNLFFPDLQPDTVTNKILSISSFLTEYVYSYLYQSTFPTILGNMKNVTQSTTQKVHLISFGIIFGAYLITTIFGFIMSDNVPTEIFKYDNSNYFKGGWKYLIIPYKIVLCAFYLTLIPLRFIVLRDNYITLIGEKKMTFLKELLIISIFIFICNIFVFGVQQFDDINKNLNIKSLIQAFGGIFGVIISFVLPVINYKSVNGIKKIKSIIGYIISGIFGIAALLSTANSIYQIIFKENKSEAPQ